MYFHNINLTKNHDITGEPSFNVEITPDMIEKKLKEIKPTESGRIDGLPLDTASVISPPLSLIFTKSQNEKRLPETWKISHITLIYKKKKSLPRDYSSVSFTPVVSKVMESLIRDWLM